MPLDLIKEIGESHIVLVVIPNETYSDAILEIAKQLSTKFNSICYVSLNKLYNALIDSLKKKNIDINKFCFVDAITKTADPSFKEEKKCKCVSSPSHLTEISLSISADLKDRKPNCLLYDSLSTMLIYQKDEVVTQFVHSLVARLRSANCVTFFTALEGDTQRTLIKQLGMFVDKTVHYK